MGIEGYRAVSRLADWSPLGGLGKGDELPRQWRAYGAEMQRGGTKPSKFGIVIPGTRQAGRNRAVVATEVYPLWWSTDGRATSLHRKRQPGSSLFARPTGGR
jgi:hypothetical protein